MAEELPKVYNPVNVEKKWYAFWMEKDYFHARIDRAKKPFTIVIPPPNVTGSLHMGHALNNTIQDILIRRKRMEGEVTLWLPGTDHAGIATQNVVEKQLAKEGMTRHDLGRQKFVERVWQWKEEYGNTIIGQLKRLGCSCDWERERFTMDESYSAAIRRVFVDLYNEGLIYRGNRIINWCPRCLTALSDIEVEHVDMEGKLWYVRYPLKDSKEYLVIATTRPETMLGDTAVAVHPDDSRYQKFIGRVAVLPLVGRELPVIADAYVDPQFGTGALKITPAHDPNDFEIGQRHDLPSVNVLTPEARINENGNEFVGMDRHDCREAVVEALEEAGLIEKIENHFHAIGHCYRCHTMIEPYLSEQWFVTMKPLAKPAINVVKNGQIKFVPEKWSRVYLEWMENIKDWCISRQLWWGHQIPAWYCECGETVVSLEEPKACPKCKGSKLTQEEDVLDTWFSSALWPFATMGWPEETEDLKYFYPTSVLSTARDIIYLWVSRMIMTGLRFCGDIPFHTVNIHPTVLNWEGRRMSKSLGTGVDPLDLIEQWGTDATRFGLMIQCTQMQDMKFTEDKLEMSRNFCNKIWNASRFILMNLDGFSPDFKPSENDFTLDDRWILSRLARLTGTVNRELDVFNFAETAKALYDFFWSEFCDWYIEMSKTRLYQDKDLQAKQTTRYVLVYVLDRFLRLLHPIMPFITEEIWQRLPLAGESIMIAPYPKAEERFFDDAVEGQIRLVQEVVTGIRTIRSEFNLAPAAKIEVLLKTKDSRKAETLKTCSNYIQTLGGVSKLGIGADVIKPAQSAVAFEAGVEIFVALAALIDIETEKTRITKELTEVQAALEKVEKKLSNQGFLTKASAEVVEKEKTKLAGLQEKKEKLERELSQLTSG